MATYTADSLWPRKPRRRPFEPAGVGGSLACQQALAAAESIDALVASLPKNCINAACEEGRAWMVDRSIHRTEHLRAIEEICSRRR